MPKESKDKPGVTVRENAEVKADSVPKGHVGRKGELKAATATGRAPVKKDAGKHRILRWRGLLGYKDARYRAMVFAVIALGSAALTFTQLGFVGIGVLGEFSSYAIALLGPIALGALLFGIPLGTLLGLISGAVLLLHATLQPLDYYEMAFITPFSSVVLFTIAGLVLAFLFAVALRKDPPRVRRAVYIFIICVFVSAMVTILFTASSMLQIVVRLIEMEVANGTTELLTDNLVQTYVVLSFFQLGDVGVQFIVDALSMFAVCVIADWFIRRQRVNDGNESLMGIFRTGLFAVVLVAYMVVSSLGFVVITEQEKHIACNQMDDEIEYLITQMKNIEARQNAVIDLVGNTEMTDEAKESSVAQGVERLVTVNDLLSGYDSSIDGIILVLLDGKVMLSDDPEYKPGTSVDEILGAGWEPELKDIESTGRLSQVVYNEKPIGDLTENNAREYAESSISMDIAYMRAAEFQGAHVVIIKPATMVFASRPGVMLWLALASLALLVAVFFVASYLLRRVIIQRIDETNGVLGQIADGDLAARVNIHDSREFKSLSTGINTTVDALQRWITEAETRMDQELATAKAIQASALPRIFPPYPDIAKFDIYALMKPAKEVGGDFYDFFRVGGDDSHALGFVIADVSGKGVPAALFMMTAKTQIRNYMELGVEPGEAIENANRHLCENNDAGMFVTVFAGVLDYETGHVVYVNAGHNPPLLWRTNSWEWVTEKSGMPLGSFDGFPYESFETDLNIGDQLLLYTDGVTEAMNVEGELYGEDRLEALVVKYAHLHPRNLISKVRSELSAFTAGAVQSDDITMLALEYGVPPEVTSTLFVPADTDELPNVLKFVHTELDRRLCPVKMQKQLDIAIEELFVNVARYAYPDATPDDPGMARVSYTYSAEPPSIVVEIADEGIPYNPLAKPDAVTSDDIMEVPIGGLGILMAKRSVDEMDYERIDSTNIVTLVKKW